MHTEYSILSAYCDGGLDKTAAAIVEAHLRECEKCRAEVRFIQDLGDGLRALPTPSAPDVPFDEIVPPGTELVPSGSRSKGSVQRSWRVRPSRLAAAAVVVVMAVVATIHSLTFGAGRLMAGGSALTLRPGGGGGLALRYETFSRFASDTRIRVRIRYWVPDSLRYAQNEVRHMKVELSRTAGARFEGFADLPPGTAYAAATVEDLAGTYIDSDLGRFWEYLETDGSGHPTLEARRYQLRAAFEFDTPRAWVLAERASSEFPSQPGFWSARLSVEMDTSRAVANGAVLSAHAVRLDAFDRAARDANPGPVETFSLSRYARLLERPDLARYWERELRARHPHHALTAFATMQAVVESTAPVGEKMSALEEDWTRVEAPATAQLGLRYSYELADPVLTERWLRRYETTDWGRSLSTDTEVVRRLMQVPELWSVAELWITDRLASSRDWMGPARRLDQLRHEFEAGVRENRARLYQALSRIRLGRGDSVGGINALERSVAEVWNPRVFAHAATIRRSLGSDIRAAELMTYAQVDPVVPVEPYLSREEGAWRMPTEVELASAQIVMRERILAGLTNEYVNLDAGLRTAAGERTTLGRAAGGVLGVTLVVYSIALPLIPEEALALLQLNADQLDASGVRSVFIAGTRPTMSASEPREWGLPLHYDPEHEVWHALRAWKSVQYFVLDRDGQLRHRGEDIETALRISLLLAA